MYNYHGLAESQVEWIEICPVADLPPGERIFIEIDNNPIVIFNIAGSLYAIADVCSHDDGPVGEGDLDEFEIVCPRHGARFDVRDGKVLQLPAVIDIPAYPVREQNGNIELGMPVAG